LPKLGLALCEGKHDKYMIEDVLRRRLSISKVLNAETYREIHVFIRSKREGFMVYVSGGKPNIYRALNDLSSQLLRYRYLNSICVVVDEDQGNPVEDIWDRLRSYLLDRSKFPSEKPTINRAEQGFLLSYRGFCLRVWVLAIPGSLEEQVRAILKSKDIDYDKLDYLALFKDKKWFNRLVKILAFTAQNQ